MATQIVRLLVTGESEQKLSSDLLSLLPVARDLSALHKEVEHLARILFDEGRGFYAVKRPIDGKFFRYFGFREPIGVRPDDLNVGASDFLPQLT